MAEPKPADPKQQGLEALRRGAFGEALEALTARVAAVPEDYEAETALGMALAKLGRHPEAQERFEALVGRHPRSVSVCYHYGLALEAAGQPAAAIAAYQGALHLKPHHAGARKRLEALKPAPKAKPKPAPPPPTPVTAPDDEPAVVVEILPELDEVAFADPEPAVATTRRRQEECLSLPDPDPETLPPPEPELDWADAEFAELEPEPAPVPTGPVVDEVEVLPEPAAPVAWALPAEEPEIPMAVLLAAPEEPLPMAVLLDAPPAPRRPPRR